MPSGLPRRHALRRTSACSPDVRRGRGESGDTAPYAVEREVEDLDALITKAGGSAFVFGHSSGAALALEAAVQLGEKVKKLAMYVAPYNCEREAQNA